jgi:hypothetical protein
MRALAPLALLAHFAASGALAPAVASAQEMSASDRAAALSRVRGLAECLSTQHAEMQRLLRMIGDSEVQRDRARDPRVRADAEAAIEALIGRAAAVQTRARACVGGAPLPSPGTRVIEQGPPPDPAADAVSGTGGTVRSIEENATLTELVRVVRGEQVDGQGQLDPSEVRSAVRRIGPRLAACYDTYLRRGSVQARQLDLVFTFRGGSARDVEIERSGFSDPTFERCVRGAAQSLSAPAPRGGDATYGYTLRFGREAR